jgi:hypothetical protein
MSSSESKLRSSSCSISMMLFFRRMR